MAEYVAAGTAIYGAIQNWRNSRAANKRADAASGLGLAGAGQTIGMGKQLFETGFPMVEGAGNYYGTLLRGSRAAMAQATAGPARAITDTYRGAERSLTHAGVRGGAREVATGELARSRAGDLAGLVTGVQPGAASALSSLGTTLTGQGTGSTIGGAGIGANLYGPMAYTAERAAQRSQASTQNAGASIANILRNYQSKKGGGGGTSLYGQEQPAQ